MNLLCSDVHSASDLRHVSSITAGKVVISSDGKIVIIVK